MTDTCNEFTFDFQNREQFYPSYYSNLRLRKSYTFTIKVREFPDQLSQILEIFRCVGDSVKRAHSSHESYGYKRNPNSGQVEEYRIFDETLAKTLWLDDYDVSESITLTFKPVDWQHDTFSDKLLDEKLGWVKQNNKCKLNLEKINNISQVLEILKTLPRIKKCLYFGIQEQEEKEQNNDKGKLVWFLRARNNDPPTVKYDYSERNRRS